jgi:hypothetical protein
MAPVAVARSTHIGVAGGQHRRALHTLLTVCLGCYLYRATETYVHVAFGGKLR